MFIIVYTTYNDYSQLQSHFHHQSSIIIDIHSKYHHGTTLPFSIVIIRYSIVLFWIVYRCCGYCDLLWYMCQSTYESYRPCLTYYNTQIYISYITTNLSSMVIGILTGRIGTKYICSILFSIDVGMLVDCVWLYLSLDIIATSTSFYNCRNFVDIIRTE